MPDPDSATDVAQRFLTALERMDIDAALGCFHADGVQEMPFAPPGLPSRLDGMDALRRQYGGLPDAYDSMRFVVSSARNTDDSAYAVLEYHGTIVQRDGAHYDNDYVGLFHVVHSQIVRFTEYFNPLVLQQSFSEDRMGSTFSVEETP